METTEQQESVLSKTIKLDMTKRIYFFGEGSLEMKDTLGGKGAGLNEMTNLGIPVPPGFTITTETCNEYQVEKKWPESLAKELEDSLTLLENRMEKKFGDVNDPLLVSVRSGAKISMPGMMDTVLNLGLNDETVVGLATKSGNERFAWDAYRRFFQMFGNVVMGMEGETFEEALDEMKALKAVDAVKAIEDTDLSVEDLKEVVAKYKELVREKTGKDFPQDPREQLTLAINAVFDSWNVPRAVTYRDIHNIPHDLGTAVNVQSMVFGNMGETSGTGVAFTRNPSTGEKMFYGEFLMNAQGEDVVAGIRTPKPIAELEGTLPEAYKQLEDIYKKLEAHYKDMLDIEFTIQEGRLFMLQTRVGKRTAAGAMRMAVEMVEEGLIDKKTAVMRVSADQVDQLLHPTLDPNHDKPVVAKGLPASPGAASGKVVFDNDQAREMTAAGEKVILVRKETSPDDIEGMHLSEGILTSTGGMTSHAAVVARGMNKCCIAGCGDIVVNKKANKFLLPDGTEVQKGDHITLNGTTGEVILGEVKTIPVEMNEDMVTVLSWADTFAKMGVRTNADTPGDAKKARDFGAIGIGLCRTEHMFFEADRIPVMQEMILAKDTEGRVEALNKLEVMQTADFEGIFRAMDGLPVTVRLLDPPLHEFLPRKKADIEALAAKQGLTYEQLRDVIESLAEVNPMLGHRGCRLMVTYPEITVMQTRAILNAANKVASEGIDVKPEIMIPLVGTVEEYEQIEARIRKTAGDVAGSVDYKVGTMIEIPRACLIAEQIAAKAEFFSFGTNDLTQMTYGYSRDDIGKFVEDYKEQEILKVDPFVSVDQEGVGQLVTMATQKGREAKADLKVGVCGEHGGDPASVEFFHRNDLNYVSCSPYRVPVARLAAAQANLK